MSELALVILGHPIKNTAPITHTHREIGLTYLTAIKRTTIFKSSRLHDRTPPQYTTTACTQQPCTIKTCKNGS